jgi:hypothetical protein
MAVIGFGGCMSERKKARGRDGLESIFQREIEETGALCLKASIGDNSNIRYGI